MSLCELVNLGARMMVPVTFGGLSGMLSLARSQNAQTGADEPIVCLDGFDGSGNLVEQWRRRHEPAPHSLASVRLKDTSRVLFHAG